MVPTRLTGLHAGFIIWDTARLVLAAKSESPEYVAVIECVPVESVFVDKTAALLDTVPVPIALPAS